MARFLTKSVWPSPQTTVPTPTDRHSLPYPTRFFEEEARVCGYRLVAGLDEAGRGPIAGPVIGAAVVLPRGWSLPGLNDSKLVGPAERESLCSAIIQHAIGWSIGLATEAEIDSLNIVEATRLAWTRAIANLAPPPDFLLVDGTIVSSVRIPQRTVVKGDQLSVSIAAASILAKVQRDRLMNEYHTRFPLYNFHLHKGYPTPEHLQLLDHFGPCAAHRRTFRPVSEQAKRQEAVE